MLTLTEFKMLAKATGQPVTWTQAKAPNATATIARAIVQSTAKATESIINAYGVNGTSIQFSVADVPVEPEKFDAVVNATGERFVINDVIKHFERQSGALIYFTCYSKGK